MDEQPRLYLGAYALCEQEGTLLLARISAHLPFDAGAWTLPGGGVLPGEHPDAALVRELREEAGLVATSAVPIAVYSHTYERSPTRPLPPVQHVGLLYRVPDFTGTLAPEIDGTTEECAWVPYEQLESLQLVDIVSFVLPLLRTEPT